MKRTLAHGVTRISLCGAGTARSRALACLTLLALAASASAAPDWIDGKSRKYPRSRHLVGVGFGDDRAVAEDRARAAISRIFSTLVTARTDFVETERNVRKDGKSESSFSQSISENVQTASEAMLEGVDIVENWRDKKARRHYALAVLERVKGMTSLRERISEFDAQVGEWNKSMGEAEGRFNRVKAALKIKALLSARADLNAKLRVLDPGGRGQPLALNEAQVRSRIAKAISELEIIVDLRGRKSRMVETGIVKALTALGLEAKRGRASEEADIVVEGDVETHRLRMKDERWKWARSSVTVVLKDARSDRIFLQFDSSSRQASAEYAEAVRRSLKKLSADVARSTSRGISEYFENQ